MCQPILTVTVADIGRCGARGVISKTSRSSRLCLPKLAPPLGAQMRLLRTGLVLLAWAPLGSAQQVLTFRADGEIISVFSRSGVSYDVTVFSSGESCESNGCQSPEGYAECKAIQANDDTRWEYLDAVGNTRYFTPSISYKRGDYNYPAPCGMRDYNTRYLQFDYAYDAYDYAFNIPSSTHNGGKGAPCNVDTHTGKQYKCVCLCDQPPSPSMPPQPPPTPPTPPPSPKPPPTPPPSPPPDGSIDLVFVIDESAAMDARPFYQYTADYNFHASFKDTCYRRPVPAGTGYAGMDWEVVPGVEDGGAAQWTKFDTGRNDYGYALTAGEPGGEGGKFQMPFWTDSSKGFATSEPMLRRQSTSNPYEAGMPGPDVVELPPIEPSHRCQDPLPDAQAIARGIMGSLSAAASCEDCHVRFGVVGYASDAYVGAPLSCDTAAAGAAIDRLQGRTTVCDDSCPERESTIGGVPMSEYCEVEEVLQSVIPDVHHGKEGTEDYFREPSPLKFYRRSQWTSGCNAEYPFETVISSKHPGETTYPTDWTGISTDCSCEAPLQDYNAQVGLTTTPSGEHMKLDLSHELYLAVVPRTCPCARRAAAYGATNDLQTDDVTLQWALRCPDGSAATCNGNGNMPGCDPNIRALVDDISLGDDNEEPADGHCQSPAYERCDQAFVEAHCRLADADWMNTSSFGRTDDPAPWTNGVRAAKTDTVERSRAAAGLVGARDGTCTDGGSGSLWVNSGPPCERGTDCADCGPRYTYERNGQSGDKGISQVYTTTVEEDVYQNGQWHTLRRKEDHFRHEAYVSISDGLAKAHEELKANGRPGAKKIVVLISASAQTVDLGDEPDDAEGWFPFSSSTASREAASELKADGVEIFGFAFGSAATYADPCISMCGRGCDQCPKDNQRGFGPRTGYERRTGEASYTRHQTEQHFSVSRIHAGNGQPTDREHGDGALNVSNYFMELSTGTGSYLKQPMLGQGGAYWDSDPTPSLADIVSPGECQLQASDKPSELVPRAEDVARCIMATAGMVSGCPPSSPPAPAPPYTFIIPTPIAATAGTFYSCDDLVEDGGRCGAADGGADPTPRICRHCCGSTGFCGKDDGDGLWCGEGNQPLYSYAKIEPDGTQCAAPPSLPPSPPPPSPPPPSSPPSSPPPPAQDDASPLDAGVEVDEETVVLADDYVAPDWTECKLTCKAPSGTHTYLATPTDGANGANAQSWATAAASIDGVVRAPDWGCVALEPAPTPFVPSGHVQFGQPQCVVLPVGASLDDPCTQCQLHRHQKRKAQEQQTQPPSRKLSERADAADPAPSVAQVLASNKQLQQEKMQLQEQVAQLQASNKKLQANLDLAQLPRVEM